MRKVYPEHGYEVAMQNPNLIKSAEGNNGMFNITDSNIYKAVAPVALTTGAYLKTKKRNGGILYK
jgi:transposase